MKIGFVGLGNMGAPMALNLLKAGHDLAVFDLSTQAVQQLVDAGAKKAVAALENHTATTANASP